MTAPNNRTLTCSLAEQKVLSNKLFIPSNSITVEDIIDQIIAKNFWDVIDLLPKEFVDLLILDLPYNLTKNYNGNIFQLKQQDEYRSWFASVVEVLMSTLKHTASIYVCSDWRTSTLIFPILNKHLNVRNRITWERDKGRGCKTNWKNNLEDIWYCTRSKDYCFNLNEVKLKRRVIAPYRFNDEPKDWQEEATGNYRLTHPSNLWTDITVPFWSMPENTNHPTQKPEKLLAKLIMASSLPKDMVFDPFLGSGTTAIVAYKLNRHFCEIEINKEYCCWALKRLELAKKNKTIQGYTDGVFYERNIKL